MRRLEMVFPDGLWTREDLARNLGAGAGEQVHVLVDRGEEHGFSLLLSGGMPDPGQRVVIYVFDPRSDEDLAAVNAGFATYYVAARRGPWADERAVIDQVVPESGADVLEICCGAGRTAPALVRRGNRVTAIDLSEDCIRKASAINHSRVDYRVADATRLPFADGSYDFGLCFENSLGVFFSRRAQVVSELIRVSRKQVLFGLRQVPTVPDDEVQVYSTRTGYLEVAQVHSRASVEKILDSLPAEIRGRIATRRWLDGDPRPWGGRELYLILDLL